MAGAGVLILEVVVGDVVFLKIEDQIPVDGFLLNGQLYITGENDHVKSNDRENLLLYAED